MIIFRQSTYKSALSRGKNLSFVGILTIDGFTVGFERRDGGLKARYTDFR